MCLFSLCRSFVLEARGVLANAPEDIATQAICRSGCPPLPGLARPVGDVHLFTRPDQGSRLGGRRSTDQGTICRSNGLPRHIVRAAFGRPHKEGGDPLFVYNVPGKAVAYTDCALICESVGCPPAAPSGADHQRWTWGRAPGTPGGEGQDLQIKPQSV